MKIQNLKMWKTFDFKIWEMRRKMLKLRERERERVFIIKFILVRDDKKYVMTITGELSFPS